MCKLRICTPSQCQQMFQTSSPCSSWPLRRRTSFEERHICIKSILFYNQTNTFPILSRLETLWLCDFFKLYFSKLYSNKLPFQTVYLELKLQNYGYFSISHVSMWRMSQIFCKRPSHRHWRPMWHWLGGLGLQSEHTCADFQQKQKTN